MMRLSGVAVVAFLINLGGCGGHVGGGFVEHDAAGDAPLPADAKLPDAPLPGDAALADAPLPDAPVPTDGPLPDAALPDARPADARLIDAAAADAALADARPADARPEDARLADARVSDARLADARPIDAAQPPDAAVTDARVCDPILTTLTDPPYLIHEDGQSTNVASVVTGTGPFTCSYYNGGGRGTRPSGVSLTSGCALTGGTAGDDAPGQYGFIVIVQDPCGQTVDVPIAFDAGACNPEVTLTPAAWPPRVPADPTAGYAWHITYEIDLVSQNGGGCAYCSGMSMGTIAPLTPTSGLGCANPGTVCSDCAGCVSPISGCPPAQTTITMSRDLTIKPHAALRGAGVPGWATLEVNARYSGTTLNPNCGPNVFLCHLESLEQ